MRSLIIYEVEHGETTDPITGLLDDFDEAVRNMVGATFVNSTVAIDQPAHITATAVGGILS
jgi:hypothetical protein